MPAAAERMAPPAGLIAKVLLAAGILAVLAAVYPAVFALIGNGTILAMAAFVTAGLAVGHLLGGPRSDERVVLALSVASRHPAIALTVARVNFPDEPYPRRHHPPLSAGRCRGRSALHGVAATPCAGNRLGSVRAGLTTRAAVLLLLRDLPSACRAPVRGDAARSTGTARFECARLLRGGDIRTI